MFIMKTKLLLLILFGVFFANTSSLANHCGHDMDRSWFYSKSSLKKYDYYSQTYKYQKVKKNYAKYQVWTFKNKTNKKITIKRIGLYASDNKTVMKRKNIDLYLKPFGVITATMYIGDLNLDVSGYGFSACRYGQPVVKKNDAYKKKPNVYLKPKKSYKSKSKNKRYDDNFTLFNLLLLVISGLLILIFAIASQKNQYKNYIKTFPRVFDFADQTIICFKKYSVFKGRASRREYWYFYLFTFIVSLLTYFIDISIFRKDPEGILFIYAFFSMLTLLPSLAVGCRRLHDVNKSGWWQLISITVIGLIPLIIWLASKPAKEKNKY